MDYSIYTFKFFVKYWEVFEKPVLNCLEKPKRSWIPVLLWWNHFHSAIIIQGREGKKKLSASLMHTAVTKFVAVPLKWAPRGTSNPWALCMQAADETVLLGYWRTIVPKPKGFRDLASQVHSKIPPQCLTSTHTQSHNWKFSFVGTFVIGFTFTGFLSLPGDNFLSSFSLRRKEHFILHIWFQFGSDTEISSKAPQCHRVYIHIYIDTCQRRKKYSPSVDAQVSREKYQAAVKHLSF